MTPSAMTVEEQFLSSRHQPFETNPSSQVSGLQAMASVREVDRQTGEQHLEDTARWHMGAGLVTWIGQRKRGHGTQLHSECSIASVSNV